MIGVFKNGKIHIVPNSIGDPLTPSIVEILEKGEAIGEEIMLHKADEKHTISEIKRIIGKNYSELEDLNHINYNIIPNDNDKILIKIERKGKEEFFSPEEIMSLIFKKLIKNASDFMETKITKAVITVPANFNYNQRSAIVESAKLAGIEVLRIINEPTAAALAYGLGTEENLSDSISITIIKKDNKISRKVLVFDLGGGTFDVTILTIENNKFDVKATLGDTHLGGSDFDNILVDFCIKDFCDKMDINKDDILKDSNALKRLKNQCEKAKKKLSYNLSTSIKIYNFFNGINLYMEITRERFNQECENLYKRIENILDKVIIDSTFNIEEIDDVILIGGSSRIPKIKDLLTKKFDETKIRDNLSQDEAVAIGATWQAHKLIKSNNTIGDIDILDITPFSLGVAIVSKIKEERIHGKKMSFLIKKNSKIPIRSETQVYKSIKDDQTYFNIQIYSGEELFVKDNKLLKDFQIGNLPKGKAGSVTLSINFEIDVNGILIINAEVESIGKKVTEKYSLYENENSGKKSLKLSKKTKENEKLVEIKQITEFISEKNDALKNVENEKDKNDFLNDLIDSCIQIIKIYELLAENNDSENIYEKIFDYTKLLLNYYSQKIINDSEEKYTSEIINKIKEILPKFINENIENLIYAFKDLIPIKPKIYIEIILFCAELLYKEGDRILNERKKYARYYSRKFYQKADNIKKLIDKELEQKMDYKLNNLYNDMKKKYESKMAEINSFVSIVKDQIEGKKPPLFQKTGFTSINNILSQNLLEADNIYLILDIYQEMRDSLAQGQPTEAEAFILVNIIIINFDLFKNTKKEDLELYDKLIRRIEFICEKIDIDIDIDDEDIENNEEIPKWIKDYLRVKKEIENIGSKTIIVPEIQSLIDEVNNIYNNKIKENKPMEFLNFITEKYPYANFNNSKNENLNKDNFEEYFITIFPKYHPDNYKGHKYYRIYNEIYMLLVKIDEKFIKNKNN